jgi:hypothetical protein
LIQCPVSDAAFAAAVASIRKIANINAIAICRPLPASRNM